MVSGVKSTAEDIMDRDELDGEPTADRDGAMRVMAMLVLACAARRSTSTIASDSASFFLHKLCFDVNNLHYVKSSLNNI